MSGQLVWPHATKSEPCPVCGRPDWCRFGERSVVCMRVTSANPCPSGGHYHFRDEIGLAPKAALTDRKATPARAAIDAAAMMRRWRTKTSLFQFSAYASELGVLAEAVVAMGAAYAPEHAAWAWPMSDGEGQVVGVRLRNRDGFKWAVPGSRGGVFVPLPSVHLTRLAYLPEGPTSSAALLSLGLYPVGRPSCNSGHDQVVRTLDRLGFRTAVVVQDNDRPDKLGNRPGQVGAEHLKKRLRRPSVFWSPPLPIKDSREFVRLGGTARVIEEGIKSKVWSRV